jgi:hypothetical protein
MVAHNLGHLIRGQPGEIDSLKIEARELLAIFNGVIRHQREVRIQRNIKGVCRQFHEVSRRRKAYPIHIQPGLSCANALVHGRLDPVGFENLLDDLALVAAQMKAVDSGGGREFNGSPERLRVLLVEGD